MDINIDEISKRVADEIGDTVEACDIKTVINALGRLGFYVVRGIPVKTGY